MRIPLIAVLALVPGALLAQQPGTPPVWTATLGAAAIAIPKYLGSGDYRIVPLPVLELGYRGRPFYAGPSPAGTGAGLGAYVISNRRLGLALEAGVQDSRPESRADELAGMEDRDAVATAGGHIVYRFGAFQAVAGASRGLNDGAGWLGTARIAVSQVLGRFVVMAGTGVTFADARQMRRDFGVTEIEADRRQALIAAGDTRLIGASGAAYRPDGGLRQVGLSASVAYVLTSQWSLMGFGGLDLLSDQAVNSPLVEQREQGWGGIGLRWRL